MSRINNVKLEEPKSKLSNSEYNADAPVDSISNVLFDSSWNSLNSFLNLIIFSSISLSEYFTFLKIPLLSLNFINASNSFFVLFILSLLSFKFSKSVSLVSINLSFNSFLFSSSSFFLTSKYCFINLVLFSIAFPSALYFVTASGYNSDNLCVASANFSFSSVVLANPPDKSSYVFNNVSVSVISDLRDFNSSFSLLNSSLAFSVL